MQGQNTYNKVQQFVQPFMAFIADGADWIKGQFLGPEYTRIRQILKYDAVKQYTTISFEDQHLKSIYNPVRTVRFQNHHQTPETIRIAETFLEKVIGLCQDPQNYDSLAEAVLPLTRLETSKKFLSDHYPQELSNAVVAESPSGLAGPVECAAAKVLLELAKQGHQMKDPDIAKWVEQTASCIEETSAAHRKKTNSETFFKICKEMGEDGRQRHESYLVTASQPKNGSANPFYKNLLAEAVISGTPKSEAGWIQLSAAQTLVDWYEQGYEMTDPEASQWVADISEKRKQRVISENEEAKKAASRQKPIFAKPL